VQNCRWQRGAEKALLLAAMKEDMLLGISSPFLSVFVSIQVGD
jgi:hypothetical protein